MMSGGVEDVFAQVGAWRDQGERVALATVIATWGSSPRPVGSQMAVTQSGRIVGSVSGGCVESAVAEAGLLTLSTGQPQILDYGVSNERAWEIGLPCGGRLRVFVEEVG
jgi:xanthine/CO dehydrogenase XdhC/CoxF family maturation factor